MPEEIKTAQTTVDTEVDSHADVDTTKDDVNDVEFRTLRENRKAELPLRRKPELLKQRNRTPKTLAVGVRQNAKPNSKERRQR